MKIWRLLSSKGWLQTLILVAVCSFAYYYTKLAVFKYVLLATAAFYLIFAIGFTMLGLLGRSGFFDIDITKPLPTPSPMQPRKQRLMFLAALIIFYAFIFLGLFCIPPKGGHPVFFGAVFYVIMYLAIEAFRKYTWINIPSHSIMNICSQSAVAAASLYYITYGQSVVYISISILLLISCSHQFIVNLYLLIANSYIIRQTAVSYDSEAVLPCATPIILVRSHLTSRFTDKFVLRVYSLIWKFGYSDRFSAAKSSQDRRPNATIISRFLAELFAEVMKVVAMFRHRIFISFINTDELDAFSSETKSKVLFRSSGYVAIISSYSYLHRNSELHWQCYHCPGPVILITLDHFELIADKVSKLQGYEIIDADSADLEAVGIGNTVARVSHTIAECSPFLNSSDANLSILHRHQILDLSEKGFPPIADCYLRFRLSKSSVERFLSILDCFEALVKLSVIILLCSEQAQEIYLSKHTPLLNKPPSFGSWARLLTILLQNETNSILKETMRCFWYSKTGPISYELEEIVNSSGFLWRGKHPTTILKWLGWIIWLRNVSKGHGGVQEDSIAPSLHKFHEMFLEIISLSRSIFIESNLIGFDSGRNKYTLKGWLRGGVRSSLVNILESVPIPYFQVGLRGGMLPLFPFVTINGNRCMVWNATKKPRLEYVDYSTGGIESLSLESCDLFEMWRRSQLTLIEI